MRGPYPAARIGEVVVGNHQSAIGTREVVIADRKTDVDGRPMVLVGRKVVSGIHKTDVVIRVGAIDPRRRYAVDPNPNSK